LVTGRHRRRQQCRPRQLSAGCARRRPTAAPEDAGSNPATSTNQECRPRERSPDRTAGQNRCAPATGRDARRRGRQRRRGTHPTRETGRRGRTGAEGAGLLGGVGEMWADLSLTCSSGVRAQRRTCARSIGQSSPWRRLVCRVHLTIDRWQVWCPIPPDRPLAQPRHFRRLSSTKPTRTINTTATTIRTPATLPVVPVVAGAPSRRVPITRTL